MRLLLRLSLAASLFLLACRPDGADSDGGTGGGSATGGGTGTGGGAATRVPVTVTLSGDGVGVITSTPPGLSCPGTCTLEVEPGTSVTLAQVAASGSSFSGWSGACTGAGPCTFTATSATTVIAGFAKNNTLLVTRAGNGTGTVTSAPAGIDCGVDCTESYAPDVVVTLAAVPSIGSSFTGWSGACSGMGACSVTMAAAQSVTATFTLAQFALTVARAGSGDGQVFSAPAGISCGTDCIESYDAGTLVTLTASAASGSSFTGWSGACTGTAACTVTVGAATSVTATFAKDRVDLSVMKLGTGSGAVSSTPAGISCGPSCVSRFDVGTVVTLTATPDTGSTFTGWTGGGCSGTGTCVVTLTAADTVSATFTLDRHPLTVTRTGTGAGTVTSSPVGISCGADCTEPFDFGTMVTLTATADRGSTFAGWTGSGCTGTGTCTVTVMAAQLVSADFSLDTHVLTVARTGSGAGTVTSSPAGISCGTDCSEPWTFGTMVTLTAAPSAGSRFDGWSGGCTGTGSCVVTVDAAKTVSASFTSVYALTVRKSGSGAGTITSSPAGINCGATCTADFDAGATAVLTASPAPGSTFTGWSGGGCTGLGTCSVTMSAATLVSATFTLPTLTVELLGTGSPGLTVTSSPAGITCGTSCTGTFAVGTAVTLTATSEGAVFTGWTGGGCTGTGTCTVNVNANMVVRAGFRPLRVALEASANSCLRGATEVYPRAKAVLEARGHTVGIVTGAELSTTTALASWDVVVLPGVGAVCAQPDWATFETALVTWVNAGGGVVGTGWQVFTSTSPAIIDLLPVNTSTNYFTGAQTVVPFGHPITVGVGSFATLEYLPWSPQRSGTITFAQVGTTSVASGRVLGTGRSVYLGPMYLESYGAYQNEALLDGSSPAALEFFARSVEWAGKAR